jgi:hypothetical protein
MNNIKIKKMLQFTPMQFKYPKKFYTYHKQNRNCTFLGFSVMVTGGSLPESGKKSVKKIRNQE